MGSETAAASPCPECGCRTTFVFEGESTPLHYGDGSRGDDPEQSADR